MKILIAALIALAVIIVVLYFAIKYENSHFKITEYTLKCKKLSKPLKLCVIADLHNYSYGEGNEQLLSAIDSLNPDYVISAGDMIESSTLVQDPLNTVKFLKKVAAKHKFIYGYGNHEWKLMNDNGRFGKNGPAFKAALLDAEHELLKEAKAKSKSIQPVDNEVVSLPEYNTNVYCLNLEYDYFRKIKLKATSADHINELVGSPSEDSLNILIGHNPDHFDSYVKWGADLVLSGHIHGGMVALPGGRGLISPMFLPFPRYYAGIYEKNNTRMIVSRGLGNHTVHIRLFNRAELLSITLIPE